MNGKSYAAANTKSTQHRTSSRRPALPALSFRREFSKGILPASFDVVFRFSCHSVSDEPSNVKTHERVAADETRRCVLFFLPEPFALPRPRLVFSESLGGSAVAPPSISSVSYGDHDCFFDLPTHKGEAGCPLKRSVSTCDHGMTRAALHASYRTRRVRLILPQHPVHPYGQLARDHHLGQRLMFARRQTAILPPQLFIESHSRLCRFHQQRAHHGVPLLADRSQFLTSARGMLAGNQSQITGHLLAARKPSHRPERQRVGQPHHWPHARMGHQQPHFWPLFSFRA